MVKIQLRDKKVPKVDCYGWWLGHLIMAGVEVFYILVLTTLIGITTVVAVGPKCQKVTSEQKFAEQKVKGAGEPADICESGWPRHRDNREFGSYFFQTGKTQNFVVTQGKFLVHRENIFDCIYYCKKHVSLHISSIFLTLASLSILSTFRLFFLILFLPVYFLSYFVSISHWLQVSTKLI